MQTVVTDREYLRITGPRQLETVVFLGGGTANLPLVPGATYEVEGWKYPALLWRRLLTLPEEARPPVEKRPFVMLDPLTHSSQTFDLWSGWIFDL